MWRGAAALLATQFLIAATTAATTAHTAPPGPEKTYTVHAGLRLLNPSTAAPASAH